MKKTIIIFKVLGILLLFPVEVVLSMQQVMKDLVLKEEITIKDLPKEVIKHEIFGYLDPESIVNLRLINKDFKKLVSEMFELVADPSLDANQFLCSNVKISSIIIDKNKLKILEKKLSTDNAKKVIFKEAKGVLKILSKQEVINRVAKVIDEKIKDAEFDFSLIPLLSGRSSVHKSLAKQIQYVLANPSLGKWYLVLSLLVSEGAFLGICKLNDLDKSEWGQQKLLVKVIIGGVLIFYFFVIINNLIFSREKKLFDEEREEIEKSLFKKTA